MQKTLNFETQQEKMAESEESYIEYFDPRQYLQAGLTEKDILQLKEVFESFCNTTAG